MAIQLKLAIQDQDQKPPLEAFAMVENNRMFWWASWYAEILGYKSLQTFKEVIQKARDTCLTLGVSLEDNINKEKRKLPKKSFVDFRISKFFCFLLAFHADSRKPVVKRARLYFLNELQELNIHLDADDYFERRALRDSIRNTIHDLNSEAKRAKVAEIRNFITQGYLGLYNQSIQDLKKKRGVAARDDIYDYMGMTEMSANLFRLALTEERIKRLKNKSDRTATLSHWKISKSIREMIRANTGKFPEELNFETGLTEIERELKSAMKILNAEISLGMKKQFPQLSEEE